MAIQRYEEEKRWLNFPEDLDGLKGIIDDDGTVTMKKAPSKNPDKSIKLINKQLLWRDFYHFVAMDADDKLFKVEGFTTKSTGWNLNDEYIAAWKTGNTGYPIVDANMRELSATGFMSGRGTSALHAGFANSTGALQTPRGLCKLHGGRSTWVAPRGCRLSFF